MKTLAERMMWARKEKRVTQAQLAKAIGASQSTIGNLESGLRRTSRRIVEIAAQLDVNPTWLATGKGEAHQKLTDQLGGMQFARIEAFEEGNERRDMVRIRKVTLRLSAGIAGFTVEPAEEDDGSIAFKKTWLEARGYKPEKLVATPVYGASMETGLFDGDTVVVNTADTEPKDGAVFAVNYEGEAIIKRLVRDSGDWWLSSDNPDQIRYPRKRCRGETCLLIGRVIHKQSEHI